MTDTAATVPAAAAGGGLGAIPAPPRHVRWRAAFRCRWPLGVISVAVLVPGVLAAVLLQWLGLSVLPLADDALDAQSAVVEGRIVAVEPTPLSKGGRPLVRVSYRYVPGNGETLHEAVLAPRAPTWRAAATWPVEFAPATPEVSRLRGTRRNPLAAITRPVLGLVLMPALLVFLLWVRLVVRTRLLLATGELALARIEELRLVTPLVQPAQLRVGYAFTAGAAATTQRSSQHVGRHTPLGQRLHAGATTAPVVFLGAGRPSRLVHATDFADRQA